MPTYTIEGKRIKTDAPLSDADIDEIASNLRGKALAVAAATEMPAAAKPSGSLMDLVGQGYLATSRAATDPNYRTVVGTGLTDMPVAIGELTGLVSPEAVRAREARYQQAAAEGGEGAGFGRFMGGAITTAPLMAVPGAGPVANLLARTAIGAGTGAIVAPLTMPTTGEGDFWAQKGQQALMGGTFGAALPLAGYGLDKIGQGWGAMRNMLSPEAGARQMVVSSLGDDANRIAAVKAANAAQPTASASRIAAGLEPGDPTYSALLRTAERVDPKSAAWRTAQAAEKANQSELSLLADGATNTETKAARDAAYKALGAKTEPIRQAVKAGTESAKPVAAYEPTYEAVGGKIHRGVQINDVVASIRADIEGKPGVRASEVVQKAVDDIKGKLAQWADDKGFINFEDLHTIRKEIGNVIDKYAKENATWDKKLTGGLQNSIQDYIDDAIEKAGGKQWRQYLETFSTGAQDIAQKKLLGELADLYRTNKARFVSVVKGDDPEFVQGILGNGKYNLPQELGATFDPLRRIARDAEREITAGMRATEGAPAFNRVLAENQAKARIPNLFNPKITVGNKVLEGLEGKINAKTMRILTDAVQSGASMNELLNFVPPAERSVVKKAFQAAGAAAPNAFTINLLTPANRNEMVER